MSGAMLSAPVRAEIDHWVAKFPEGRQRSAVIGALQAVQHENQGFLTEALMDAVAAYLDLPPIQSRGDVSPVRIADCLSFPRSSLRIKYFVNTGVL